MSDRFIVQYWKASGGPESVVGTWNPIRSDAIETEEEAIDVAKRLGAARGTPTRVLREVFHTPDLDDLEARQKEWWDKVKTIGG